MMTRTLRRRQGQALVETALILPLLVFMIVALYDATFLVFVRVSADHALSETLNAASRQGPEAFTPTALRESFAERALGVSVDDDALQVTRRPSSHTGAVVLTVDVRFSRRAVSSFYLGDLGTVEQVVRQQRVLAESVVGS